MEDRGAMWIPEGKQLKFRLAAVITLPIVEKPDIVDVKRLE